MRDKRTPGQRGRRHRDSPGATLRGPSAPAGSTAPAALLGHGGLIVGLGVFVVTAAVFLPALRNGFVEWDDPSTITGNPHVHSLASEQLRWMFTTFYWGHYQPLLWLSYALDHAWAAAVLGDGLAPAAYHATSVLLHAIATVLVFFLARRLLVMVSRRLHPGSAVSASLPALGAALLFGLHPLRVEPVAWATGRGDVLAGVFLFASVLAYLRAREGATAASRTGWLIGAIVAHALSLLCRAMGVTLPLVLILLDCYPLQRLGGGRGRWFGRRAWPVWIEKLPFAVLSAAAAVLAPLAKASVGATVELTKHGAFQRIAQACYGILFYLWKTVFPSGLSPIYELHLPIDVTELRYSGSVVIVLLGAVALLIVGRRRPAVPACLAAYVILLLPVLGLVQSGNQLGADRYSYLPVAALAMLLAGGMAWLLTPGHRHVWERSVSSRTALVFRLGPVCVAVAACAVLTVRQIGVWRSTEALWTHAAVVAPDSSIAQNGYGWVLLQAGRYDEALSHLRLAVKLQPSNEQAHNNIWNALGRQGRTDELLQAYRDSIQVYPDFLDAHYNLGVELQRRGQIDDAMTEYRAVLTLRPRHSKALTNSGQLLQQKGEPAAAQAYYEQAIQADDRNVIARRNLARLLRSQNRPAEAIAQLEAALRVAPDDEATRKLLAEWGNRHGDQGP
jgi:protein O-mannosyl-transferase